MDCTVYERLGSGRRRVRVSVRQREGSVTQVCTTVYQVPCCRVVHLIDKGKTWDVVSVGLSPHCNTLRLK